GFGVSPPSVGGSVLMRCLRSGDQVRQTTLYHGFETDGAGIVALAEPGHQLSPLIGMGVAAEIADGGADEALRALALAVGGLSRTCNQRFRQRETIEVASRLAR